MRLKQLLAGVVLPLLLLLPTTGAPPTKAEPAWREGGWMGALSVPRPSLPGQKAFLESAGPLPTDVRLRLYRIEDPSAFLRATVAGRVALEGGRAAQDPLDVLREAILWGGRRAYVTAHRTATRALRDTLKQTDRLQAPRLPAVSPREGEALPLQGQKGLTFLEEWVPKVTEDITGKAGQDGEEDGDESGERGQLTRAELPVQPAGLYLVEVLRGNQAAYVPWLVTDLALLAEQDGGTLRLQAVRAQDGALLGGATGVVIEGREAKPLAFDAEGRASAPASPGVRRVVLAGTGKSFALLAIEGQSIAAVRQRLFAYTERPLYRPGQEVFAKAVLRTVREGENEVAKGVAELPYTVLDPEDTKVAEGRAALLGADTGTYGVQFTLPAAGRLGLFRVVFQGPEGPGQAEFKVEHFVKPAFSVTVTTPETKVGLGDALRFHAKAAYFYGAAVRNAKADWFLYTVAPRQSRWVGWDDEDQAPVPELVESGEVSFDADGEADLPEFPAKKDGLYRMVVKVADASGQRNSGQAQVRASAGDLVLLVGADRQVAAPGKPFTATSRVVDLDGQELKGQAVSLRVAKIVADRTDRWWWSRPAGLKPGETVASAPGPKASLTVAEGGLYLLVAETTDRKGRPVLAQRLITVAAEGTPLPSVPDLRASADKPQYQPGDTARILVLLPKPKLTLHWSLEHERLGERRTRVVNGTTAVLEVPVTAAMQPNAWIVVEVVADGRRQLAEVPLRAPKLDRRLQVEVKPDKDRYQPGAPMTVAVSVKDHAGRPAAADLSVGVVDEAIYALSQELHPDPVRFFHPTRRHGVLRAGSTDWSFFDLLHHQRPVWSLKQTKRGEFKADDADKVRQNFKDTAAWVPMLAVGSDGQATTTLTLPDNLTAWRATATAFTPDTKVGVGRASRPSSKPLQVSLTLPRTLATGEEARAIALVRNLSGRALSGKVKLEATGGALKGTPEAAFSLRDQEEFRFALPVGASAVGTLAVTARVEGGGLKDAERQKVQVVDPLIPASVSGCVVLDGEPRTVTVPAPPKAAGEATFVLTPVGSLEHLILPSLPYLVGYPYGCVEQTLSSFVPNVLVADLVKQGAMPPLDWKQLVDLDRNIRDGVFRVYGYQQPGGGWGWYAPADFGVDANPHTTGYALQSFATMKRLGYAVDAGVVRRGTEAAFRLYREVARQADAKRDGGQRQPGQLEDPVGDAAFLLLSLAATGEPMAGMVDSAADKVLDGRWPGANVLAMVSLAAAQTRHPKAPALLEALEKAAVTKGGLARWEAPATHWHGYVGGELTPTVMALKALCLGRPASPLIRSGEAFLASRFQGYGWSSTWATAQVVDLIPYLAKVRKLSWTGLDLRAAVQGGPSWDFRTVDAKPRRWGSREPRPGVHLLKTPQPVTLQASGRGLLIWTYAYQVPGSAGPAEAGEASQPLRLDLKRALWTLRTPQETGDPRRGWVRTPWTGTLRQGQEAWMELEVRADQGCDYAVLEVPLPAGLEPQVKLEGFVLEGHAFGEGEATDTWMPKPRIEVRPDKVTFLFPQLYGWGSQRVRLLLRAGMAGTYKLRPAKLSLMSDETRWTTCDGKDLVVMEGGAK